jgi:nitrogen fixation protein NifX
MTVERRLKVVKLGADAMGSSTAVKVAFATGDMRHVDQHFGAAESFAVYVIDLDQSSLVEVTQFGQLAMDGNEDKLTAKISALEGCIAVYCQAVGSSAVNQLRAKGIQPVKVTPDALVADLIQGLQEELRAGPTSWLARALEARQQPRDDKRFDAMESEGWAE